MKCIYADHNRRVYFEHYLVFYAVSKRIIGGNHQREHRRTHPRGISPGAGDRYRLQKSRKIKEKKEKITIDIKEE